MPERVSQFVRCVFRVFAKVRRLKYRYFRWAVWPRRLSGNLVLRGRVRFLVPLRCDGEGVVYVSDRTKLGSPEAVRYGNGCVTLQARGRDSTIRIGEGCVFSNNVSIIAVESVEVGDGCLIGELVSILDSDFHTLAPTERRTSPAQTSPVRLENNVWLGSRVIVQKGVTIGENSVVAANAVVTTSLPANCIAGGVPARVIRTLASAEQGSS